LCGGYSSSVFANKNSLSLTCNTLSHVYASYKTGFSDLGKNVEELASLSFEKRVDIFQDYFVRKEFDEYDCDGGLDEVYDGIEQSLQSATQYESEDEAKESVLYALSLPDACLAYREVYRQRISTKLAEVERLLPEMLSFIDVLMVKMRSNQTRATLNEYCHFARKTWEQDPDITREAYRDSTRIYKLSPFCEKQFAKFEDRVFNKSGPREKDKRLDGMAVTILRGMPVFDFTASGLMERRAWLALLYKGREEQMDHACHYQRLIR
jgi:hypothetical protein